MLRHHGSRQTYLHERVGWNSRLDELQAAVLRVKLQHLAHFNDARRAVARRYREKLAGANVILPAEHGRGTHVYHQFTIRSERRDAIREALGAGRHRELGVLPDAAAPAAGLRRHRQRVSRFRSRRRSRRRCCRCRSTRCSTRRRSTASAACVRSGGMKLAFTKMQGAGNDFVVLDCTQQPFSLIPRTVEEASPTAISASAATRSWWSRGPGAPGGGLPLPHLQRRRRRGRAVRQRRALLRQVRARARPHRQARDPRRDARRHDPAAPRGRRRGERRHGQAVDAGGGALERAGTPHRSGDSLDGQSARGAGRCRTWRARRSPRRGRRSRRIRAFPTA